MSQTLERAQRHLVAKAIAEFSHERLLAPRPHADGFVLCGSDASVEYRFRATRHALEHWRVDPGSLRCHRGGVAAEIDAQRFVLDFADALAIPDQLLSTYLEEIASTLAASCWKWSRSRPDVAALCQADHQQIEAAMTEGHPGFVANNGRIGFGAGDYERYAPEVGAAVRLGWLAVRRRLAHLALGEGLTEAELYGGELDEATRTAFAAALTALGLRPIDFLLMPVHPWQWEHKISISFAPDVARRDLVWLGEGPDELQAQQSIRTFANRSRPDRHLVKVALSVQNMGFMRGLSPAYMRATPAINDWVHDLVAADEELRACGFEVLRERAAIGYTGDAYHRSGQSSAHTKMLAALWRESPVARIASGERLATMASLLHVDDHGASLAAEMVRSSGMPARAWLASYLNAYLRPLVHCLLAYDLVFMPHGENLVMVIRDQVPVRMVMKDIGEEVVVMGDLPLPEEVARIRADVPADLKPLSILTDVFDGFFRHLAALLEEHGILPAVEFWQEVADCLDAHLADHPELQEAAAAYDLRRPRFAHSCLNRLQLRNTLQMVDLSDQAQSLIMAGELENPAGR